MQGLENGMQSNTTVSHEVYLMTIYNELHVSACTGHLQVTQGNLRSYYKHVRAHAYSKILSSPRQPEDGQYRPKHVVVHYIQSLNTPHVTQLCLTTCHFPSFTHIMGMTRFLDIYIGDLCLCSVLVGHLLEICVVVGAYLKNSTTELLKREMQNIYTEFLSLHRAV